MTAAAGRISALIVDDELPARRNLAALLSQDPAIELIGDCASGIEALAEIRRHRPDLVFLDVQMPECDGFAVLERLDADLRPAIVFVTAFDRYAIRAFDAGAIDYLLKPFDDARFEQALARAKTLLARGPDERPAPALVIRDKGEITLIPPHEIDWIEAADYYACLHVGARTHLLRRSLAELEQRLDPGRFCRIHRRAIVNLERIRSLSPGRDGEYEIVLDTARLPLSRRFRRRLMQRLGLRTEPSRSGP